MERGSRSALMDQMGGVKAPRAPQPGRGSGNVPYASGMLNGQFGPQGQPAGQRPQPPPVEPVASAPPQGPAASVGSGGGPPPMGAPPPGPGAANPYLDPMFLFDVYAQIMGALLGASASTEGVY